MFITTQGKDGVAVKQDIKAVVFFPTGKQQDGYVTVELREDGTLEIRKSRGLETNVRILNINEVI